MSGRVLVTGSLGLVGAALVDALEAHGVEAVGLDVIPGAEVSGDVRDAGAVARAVEGCTGIVHLAAVSRVVWGERDPAQCWSVNVEGTRVVLEAARRAAAQPWVLCASSREVYGEPARCPVDEDAPLLPINTYARTKVEVERLVSEAAEVGLRAAVVRLSNVYGDPRDHVDRVVPAFTRAAALGASIRIDGESSTFDFTHVEDVARGLVRLATMLHGSRTAPPPMHLVSGQPTTLRELANLAFEVGWGAGPAASAVSAGEPRDYDVRRFWGDPSRARHLLGWDAEIPLRAGVRRLVAAFRRPAEVPVRA